MGIFDKLNDVAKKATNMAENYTQKAQQVIGGSLGNKAGDTSQAMYIPHPIDMKNSIPTGAEDESTWEKITGSIKSFSLCGKSFEIPENVDIYNSYRSMFLNLARKYADKAEKEYAEKVHDYITFMELFPQIYDENLYPLLKRSVDILVAEGVWSVTFNSFANEHKTNFHLAIDDYEAMAESTSLTIQANQQVNSQAISFATDLMEKRFSNNRFSASILNKAREDAIPNAIANTGISVQQQAELYQRIDSQKLFLRVYIDYLNVVHSLIFALNENGQDIWIAEPEKAQQAKNIFENLSNPIFLKIKLQKHLFKL